MALLTTSFVATTFTDSHPVMTADGPKRAGALVDGDDVLVSHASAQPTLQPLSGVRTYPRTVAFYNVEFDPDEPVESFFEPPDWILSKGASASVRSHKSYKQRQRINKNQK